MHLIHHIHLADERENTSVQRHENTSVSGHASVYCYDRMEFAQHTHTRYFSTSHTSRGRAQEYAYMSKERSLPRECVLFLENVFSS
jgi:hypothetical protein